MGEGRGDPLPRPQGPLPSLCSSPLGEEEGSGAADGGCGTLEREKGHPKGWVSFIWSSGQVGHCEFENGVKQYDYLGFASK